MQKISIFSISVIILFSSCKSATELASELIVMDCKYYKKQTKELFTGIAETKFENGLISSSTEVKAGVPNGNWFYYGYKGEVIQEGKFFPVQLQEPLITEKNIKRINISFGKEANYSFLDIYIVGEKIFKAGLSDTAKFKKDIEQLLQEKKAIRKTDSINHLFIVKGELE